MQIVAVCLALLSLMGGSCWASAIGGGGCHYGWSLTPENTCVKLFLNSENWSNAKASCRSHGSELVTLPNRRMINYLDGFLLNSNQVTSKNTPNAYAYQTIPNLDLTNKNYVRFSVKACNDAHITLQPTITGITSNAYEIVLGGWGNTQSVIRESFRGVNRATKRQNDVISCSEERLFWISWSGGKIRVGTGGYFNSGIVLLEYQDSTPQEIKSVAVSTGWGASGSWEVYNQNGALDQHFWIGGKKQSGIWRWDGVSQANIAVSDWHSGEPNDAGGNEDCIEVIGGDWNDVPCADPRRFICEMRA